MAEILRSFDWSFTSKHNETARSRTYPWDELLDGRIRRLTRGEDFDGPATSVERVIRTSANRRGIKVRVRVETDETIILQAHTDDARNMERGVTKSPSKASLDAAKDAANGNGEVAKPVTKAVAKRPVTKAPARKAVVAKGPVHVKGKGVLPASAVNGNASKRPGPTKAATPKAISKRLAKAGL